MPEVDAAFLKSQIDLMRDSIGRNVTVYTVTHNTPCSICLPSGYYDNLSDSSYYIVCPVCSGSYWVDVATATEVLARVHWVGNEAITATPGGKYFLGDAHITVDPSYQALLESAQTESGKVIVDGEDMEITRINPMGAPTINRVRAILKSMGKRPNS